MTERRPAKWEIWLAKVKFEDNKAVTKIRPVLVLSPEKYYVLSLKITSHEPRKGYSGEYAIYNWSLAGLDKPSTIRALKKLKLQPGDFERRLGRLHPYDIMAVEKLLSDSKRETKRKT